MDELGENPPIRALIDILPPVKTDLKINQPSIIEPIEKLKPGTLGNALEDEVKKRKKEKNPDLPVREYLHNLKPVDYLFVFGRGPAVIEQATKEKPIGKAVKSEALSLTRINAQAAGELYLAGLCNKIILTGGHTAGPDNPTEADGMEKILLAMGVPRDRIIKNTAGNSLENFAKSIKQAVEDNAKAGSEKKEPAKYKDIVSFGLVGHYAHIPRIRTLAYLFGLKSARSFSSEEVFKLIAYLTKNNQLHQLLDQRLSIDEDLSLPKDPLLVNPRLVSWQDTYGPNSNLTQAEKRNLPSRFLLAEKMQSPFHPTQGHTSRPAATYFERQQGEEAIGIREFLTTEQFLERGLMNETFYTKVEGENGEKKVIKINSRDYFIGYLIFLDDKSFSDALERVGYKTLAEYGIQSEMSLEEKRQKLEPYTISMEKGGKRAKFEMMFNKTDQYADEAIERLKTIADSLNP